MKPLTILIVDDLPINLKLLRAQLEAEGQTVLEAANGVEALQVLDREKVDVIISDVLMPVMDGYRLCYEVRRSERHRHLPFIVYTSTYVSPSDEKLSLDLGADRYLRKPSSVDEIMRTIREALAAPRRQPTAVLDSADVLKEYNAGLVTKLEKKNDELTSAVSQLRLQTTALETAADAIIITDANGVILWTNQAFTTTTGYTSEEAIGKTPRILKLGKQDAAFYREFWKTILSGNTWRGEFANRRKDGSLGYDVHTVTPVLGANGSVTHFVGVMHDITDRKRAEQELYQAHARLHQLLEHSPAVIYALTVDGETIALKLVSENIFRILGFQVMEAMSLDWWHGQLHPVDRECAVASIEETLTLGVSRTEYRLRHKNGNYLWVEDNRRLIRDPSGQPLELIGVWTDITERKRAQDELRERERRFREMLDNLDLVSMMLDRDGRITYCNDYFLRLTGWKREDAIGADWFEHFAPPEKADELRKAFARLLANGPQIRHYANEILTRSGERRLLQWNNSLVWSPSGDVIGMASIAEDITDRNRLEKQLLRTQRLESLGTLAGGIAHDLNNLLQPIMMGVTLLKRFNPTEPSLNAITIIERSVRRGSELVKQVLLFTRGSGTLRAPVQLFEIVREVEAIIKSTFPKDITFDASIAEDIHEVIGDPTQLSQVLLNLCVNARDAMPRGGQMRIAATNAEITDQFARLHGGKAGGRHAVLEVADTGEGMSRAIIDRIFDPFFTTKEVGKGTGLGLSTVQGIVISHGGFIDVESERDKGSTFKVFLPIHRGTPATAAGQPLAEELPRGNDELVMVVDDETSILSITGQTLETFGYQVITAENGTQALSLYLQHGSSVSVVLTDMMMPMIDGATLIAKLIEINPDVRIIAASGNSDAGWMARAAQAGAAEFLTKPYSATLMLQTVSKVLTRR
jgi:PAS domain S-box-containing protein